MIKGYEKAITYLKHNYFQIILKSIFNKKGNGLSYFFYFLAWVYTGQNWKLISILLGTLKWTKVFLKKSAVKIFIIKLYHVNKSKLKIVLSWGQQAQCASNKIGLIWRRL